MKPGESYQRVLKEKVPLAVLACEPGLVLGATGPAPDQLERDVRLNIYSGTRKMVNFHGSPTAFLARIPRKTSNCRDRSRNLQLDGPFCHLVQRLYAVWLSINLRYSLTLNTGGELCLSRVKLGETLVEARSITDVQIVCRIWV